MTLKKTLTLSLLGIALSASQLVAAQTVLLNASYDVAREFYKDYNSAFVAHYKKTTGKDIRIDQAHGGSSAQARAVNDGLDADVVTMNTTTDIEFLANSGVVAKDWAKRFPGNASPTSSTMLFLVRNGNPKNIKDWDDLVRSDVKVIFPNPKTSGNARYTYLAAYAYAKTKYDSAEKADEFIKKLFANVPVFDTGGRAATTTFVERQTGDVLITFEAETNGIRDIAGADKYQVVVPSQSLLAEFPVAVVDKYAEKHGTQALAKAYLDYLYSPEGQTILAKQYNRVNDKAVAEKFKDKFPAVKLVTIEKEFGGWDKVNAEHLNPGAKLDQLFGGANR